MIKANLLLVIMHPNAKKIKKNIYYCKTNIIFVSFRILNEKLISINTQIINEKKKYKKKVL